MKQTFENYLCFELPSFECEAGWHLIINGALICIDRHLKTRMDGNFGRGFAILQIKQKMGGLRISCVNSNSYIDGVIDLAEMMAYNTCEITGLPGSLHHRSNVFRTLSAPIATKMGFIPSERDHRISHAAKKKTNAS